MIQPRIDLLLYSHDGRGQGHVSRNVAIALAVRRLAKGVRILLLTGSPYVSDLIGDGDLDWIKLPAYRSVIVGRKSQRREGPCGLPHAALLEVRRGMITDIICRVRPKCILVDHLPLGKDGELADAIALAAEAGTKWVLGIRAIPGDIENILSSAAQSMVSRFYSEVLWYGDNRLHGTGIRPELESSLGIPVFEAGLVSRAEELARVCLLPAANGCVAGTIGLSWCDLRSLSTLDHILQALGRFAESYGKWRVFAARSGHSFDDAADRGSRLSTAWRIERFGIDYLAVLRSSRVGITYAGYNSITDILWAQKPSLLITRDSEEDEQPRHAACLKAHLGPAVAVLPEAEISPARVRGVLKGLLQVSHPGIPEGILRGSQLAALRLIKIIEKA